MTWANSVQTEFTWCPSEISRALEFMHEIEGFAARG